MTTKTPCQIRAAIAQRLSDAHADAEGADRRRRDERVAAGYRPDPRMERLLELRRSDRAAFDRMPVTARLASGHYAEPRDAHDRLRGTDDA